MRTGETRTAAAAKQVLHPVKAAQPAVPLTDIQREADQLVWSHYSHAGVIVNERLQIHHVRGNTQPYLALQPGVASLHLFKVVRPDLLIDLRVAIQKAVRQNVAARRQGIRLYSGRRYREVSIAVLPLSTNNALSNKAERFFLVLFEEAHSAGTPRPVARDISVAGDTAATTIQQELLATRKYLQAVIEEQEAINGELSAAKEEALSNNEELQSSNEELETVREELQSINQEVLALREREASRDAERALLNDDLKNILDGAQIPILILDTNRRIRRFTPAAQKLFSFLPPEGGQPIQDQQPNLDVSELQPLITHALETLAVQSGEVMDKQGRAYSICVRPYRTSDNRIDGVVLSLMDIDAIKRGHEEVRRARDYGNAIVDTIREALVVLDPAHEIVTANHAFQRMLRLSAEELERRNIFDIAGRVWDIAGLRALLNQIPRENRTLIDMQLTPVLPGVGRRIVSLNARRLHWEGETTGMMLLAIEDVTDRETETRTLHDSRDRLRDLTAGLLAAQEEERRRVSRELHDDVIQRMAMLIVDIEGLERDPLSPDSCRHKLAEIRTRSEAISDHLRQAAHRLHPSVVELLGLPAALRSLCSDFSREGLQVSYRQRDLDGPIPPSICLCLYRVAQEALRNVVRHSGAWRATLSLVRHRNSLRLSVSDTGSGFDAAVVRSTKTLGLLSMDERIRLVDGQLTIHSSPGGGTRVVATVPVLEATS